MGGSHREQLLLDMRRAFELYVSHLRSIEGWSAGDVYDQVSNRIHGMRSRIKIDDITANEDTGIGPVELGFADGVDIRKWCQKMLGKMPGSES